MIGLVLALAAALGLVTGSFLTALIPRLRAGEEFAAGRSRCPSCGKTLGWFELLPVLSFLLQGGQCRSCRGLIPRFYLWIEAVSAALFLMLAWLIAGGFIPVPAFISGLGFSPAGGMMAAFFYYAFFAAGALAVSFYDFLYGLIPGVIVWPLAAVGFAGQVSGTLFSGDAGALFAAFGAAGAAFLFFWLIWFLSGGRAMGRGDADASFCIALWLGPALAPAGFILAFWIGAVSGIIMMAAGRAEWGSRLPFAPFLFAGALAALFASEKIVQLFSAFYGI